MKFNYSASAAAAALILAGLVSSPVLAADKIKIGLVTTLTTPAGIIGNDMKNGADLALEHIGSKMG